MVTMPAAMDVAAGKLLESMTRIFRSLEDTVGGMDPLRKMCWTVDWPEKPPADWRSCPREFGRGAGKMYSSLVGNFESSLLLRRKFFSRTSGGV